jgi:Ca-activated chloride channel family protein
MNRKKKALKKFGNMATIRRLMPAVSLKKQYLKFWLLWVAAGLFSITIARPQFGSKIETVKREGIEVMVCLDVSNSMLANDIRPTRLEKAKQILSKLVDNLNNDKIGLIVFAGDAYIQLPITADYVSAKMFMSSINPAMVPAQGTVIGSAINLALRSFTPNEDSEKTIILITDAEDHEDNSVEAAENAAKKGITVNVMGIGSPKGSPILVSGTNGFFKDKDGNMVITRLNEEMAKQIAIAGNGIYVQTDNTNNALKVLQNELNKKNKSEVESKVYSSYDEKYQIPAGILLILLILEFFILDRKNKLYGKIKLFSNNRAYILLAFLLVSPFAFSQKQVRQNIRNGNKEYKQEKYTEAEINYRKALEENTRSANAAYNLGNALYKQEKGQEALEQYRAAIDNETNKEKIAAAWHNTGNVSMAAKDYAKSIEAYKQALRNNPHDDETRYNLALAQKLLQDQQNQDQNQQNKDQQEEQKQDQQQDQQQQQQDQQQEEQQQQQSSNEMSKQNADQILDALLQDEKNTQEKVKEQQMKQLQRKRTDKNW